MSPHAHVERLLAKVDADFDRILGQVNRMVGELRAPDSPPLTGGQRATDPLEEPL